MTLAMLLHCKGHLMRSCGLLMQDWVLHVYACKGTMHGMMLGLPQLLCPWLWLWSIQQQQHTCRRGG